MVKVKIYSRNRLTEVVYLNPSESDRLTKRKKVIDLIRDQPQRYGEISEKTGIAESTVNRILKELKKLGLVKKRDKKYWVWSEYENRWKGSPICYKAHVDHSINLIPGLEEFFNRVIPKFCVPWHLSDKDTNKIEKRNTTSSFSKMTNYEKLSILVECAESHLKAYPTIDKKIIFLKSLGEKFDEADSNTQEILKKVGGHVYLINDKTFEFPAGLNVTKQSLIEEGVPYILFPYLVGKHDESLIKSHNGYVRDVNCFPQSIRYKKGSLIVGIKGPIEGNFDKKTFEEIIKDVDSVEEIYWELAKQICQLILQIRQHQPLKGHCEQCPNIEIKSES